MIALSFDLAGRWSWVCTTCRAESRYAYGERARAETLGRRHARRHELEGAGELERVYLVPRSQVWEGSRGRARGLIHLRRSGERQFLCGRGPGWYEREPLEFETAVCSRCERAAERSSR